MEKVNLAEKFSKFSDPYNPRIIGEINNVYVKVVKCAGEFGWHHHDVEDELFLVNKGKLTMKLRDGDVVLNPGEFIIVPHGVEHSPVGENDCEIVLIEPNTTLNTGNVENELTRKTLERI